MASLEIKKQVWQRSERVKSVDIHPTEPWLLYSLYSGSVQIWNYESNCHVKTLEITDCPVRSSKFIARKDWLVTVADDGMLRIYNYNTLERVLCEEIHNDYIRAIDVHPTLPLLLSCGDDMTIKLYNWDLKKVVQVFTTHRHYVMDVAFNPKDTNTFASASLDGLVKFWNINSPKENFTLSGAKFGVNCVSFCTASDKPYIIAGGDDFNLNIYNYQTKTCIQTITAHAGNICFAYYHPDLPIIVSGAEDGVLNIWNANTYELEKSINYNLDRLWCGSSRTRLSYIALGYDEAVVMISIGNDSPVVSMDPNGKITFSESNNILQGNLKQKEVELDDNTDAISTAGDTEFGAKKKVVEDEDGEPIYYQTKELGTSDIFPQSINYNSNGRFVSVCGGREYVVYTALAWRSKCFGKADMFVWSSDPSQYAIKVKSDAGTPEIKLFSNFLEVGTLAHPSLASAKPSSVRAIFGGLLLAVQIDDTLCFFDWESMICIRQIEIIAKKIIWSDNGDFLSIVSNDAFYVLKFNYEHVQNYVMSTNGAQIPLDGIPDSFDLLHDTPEVIKSGIWIEDCFVFTNQANKLCQMLGSHIITMAHLEKPFFVLGYLPSEDKLYLTDKELNVIGYTLYVSVLEYQSCVLRGDIQQCQAIIERVPVSERTKLARFLESRDLTTEALELTCDDDHKFSLAVDLKRIDIAYQVALATNDEIKWKTMAKLAIKHWKYELAVESLSRCKDYQTLLMLFTAVGDADKLTELAVLTKQEELYNISFLAYFLVKNVESCYALLVDTERYPEATLFAKTYLPSKMNEAYKLWITDLKSKNLPHIANSLADPSIHLSQFPEMELALTLESQYYNKGKDNALDKLMSITQGINARKQLFGEILREDVTEVAQCIEELDLDQPEAILNVEDEEEDEEEEEMF